MEEKQIKILNIIESYVNKHPLVKSCGSEYVSQSDKAQVDAIELVCKLADLYCEE